MSKDQKMRDALIELDRLRRLEQSRREASDALVEGLQILVEQGSKGAARGALPDLLTALRQRLGADRILLLDMPPATAPVALAYAGFADAVPALAPCPLLDDLLENGGCRIIPDLSGQRDWVQHQSHPSLRHAGSAIANVLDGLGRPLLLIAFAGRRDAFAIDHGELITRYADLVTTALRQDVQQREREMMQGQLGRMQKLESLGTLAEGIAHEMNSPIQFVSNNLSFLTTAFTDLLDALNNPDSADPDDIAFLTEQIPEALAQSRQGAERVAGIVQAVRVYSHPSNLQSQQVNIGEVLDNALLISRHQWHNRIKLTTSIAAEGLLVDGTVNGLGQIFLNLITNAVEAIEAKPGGPSSRDEISITVRPVAGNRCRIDLRDTGPGIAIENLARIYDPFFTTKEVGKGTGQGLAIVQKTVVEQLGGMLDCKSRPGHGTCFTITLPLCRVARVADSRVA